MTLVRRMVRLLNADLNAVMDGLEEPQALLTQAIRDMEDEVLENRRRLQLSQVCIDELQARRKHIHRRIDKLDGELDLCFQADNDALARSLTRRKLQLERLLETTVTKLDDATATIESDTARHEACEQALAEMREKAEIVTTRTSHDSKAFADDALGQAIGSDEVEAALLREKRARSTS